MLENLSEFVGYAMHDDLLMRRQQDTRAAEAQRAREEQRRAAQRRRYWGIIAKALLALATRIAPGTASSSVATTP
jgi:hypothetical protein